MSDQPKVNAEGKDAQAAYEEAKKAEQNKIYQNNKLESLKEAQKQGQIAQEKAEDKKGDVDENRNDVGKDSGKMVKENTPERLEQAQGEENRKAAAGANIGKEETAEAREEGGKGVGGINPQQEEKGRGDDKYHGDHLKSDNKGSDPIVNTTLKDRK